MLGSSRFEGLACQGWTKRAVAYVAAALLVVIVLEARSQWKPVPQGPQQPGSWSSFWHDGDCVFETGIWPFKTTATISSEVCVEQPHYRMTGWYEHLLNPNGDQPSPPLATAMEIGIDKGQTTATLARSFKEVHIFDFLERTQKIQRQIAAKGADYGSVVIHVRLPLAEPCVISPCPTHCRALR